MRKHAATLLAGTLFTIAALLGGASPAQADPYACSSGTDYTPSVRSWSYCDYGTRQHRVAVWFTFANPHVGGFSWWEYGPCVNPGQRSEHTPSSLGALSAVYSVSC
ncbi:hypothetical protein [Sinosporangium siamense]|nr:hypothetical protein [Sinosporangium siamense]